MCRGGCQWHTRSCPTPTPPDRDPTKPPPHLAHRRAMLGVRTSHTTHTSNIVNTHANTHTTRRAPAYMSRWAAPGATSRASMNSALPFAPRTCRVHTHSQSFTLYKMTAARIWCGKSWLQLQSVGRTRCVCATRGSHTETHRWGPAGLLAATTFTTHKLCFKQFMRGTTTMPTYLPPFAHGVWRAPHIPDSHFQTHISLL